ncbi:hypothetical protein Zmor_027342 [Zophobas morio]|uniref:Trophoblast glycoprotein n=1 Tax=Zophobas morio TaxID=2755281 RepID=A0AA38HQL4_9CUCU|nr:hypothetical protein Zmor_027342 [Zophobas morio]
MLPLLALLPLLHLAAANVYQCHSKLLKGCICGKVYVNQETLFTVNCTNLMFRNTNMLEQLPEETQMLIFTGNHIPVLEMNVFGDEIDLSGLKVIDMSNNGIREIKGKAFHHVPSVERLILNHNNISISNEDDGNFHHPRVFSNFYNLQELHLTNAFADNTDAALANDLHDIFVNSNLNKLYKLHLEQNEIKFFKDENVFCDLPDLHDIYLGDNNIPSLNFNVRCLKKLRYLDLENNNIDKFRQDDLEAFDSLVTQNNKFTLELRGNPFRCDQAIRDLYNWLLQTKVEVREKDHLECHQAKYGNKYILNLKNLAVAKRAKVSQAVTILVIVLSLILVTLLAAYAYVKKDKVKSRFGPVFDALTRKVHYTTIESQDV